MENIVQQLHEPLDFNIAIVGGGRACRFYLDLLTNESFPYLNIHIVGVCDVDLEAEGIAMAKSMGIYTTDNFKDLFRLENLNAVIELTNSKALPELIASRPKGVGVIEHNVGRLLRDLFDTSQRLASAKEEVLVEKTSTDILFEQINLGVVLLDIDFTIIDANEQYLKAVRKGKEEVVGKFCYNVVKGFYAPCHAQEDGFDCPLERTVKTGKSYHIIHEHPLASGETAYFNIATYPVKDSRGRVIRIVELWRDITGQIKDRWRHKVRQIEADMKKVVQEDRLVALGKLVASSVHEINNPIQGLLTFSHIMCDMIGNGETGPADMERFSEFLTHMTRELERCGNIVSGLLTFSRESPQEFVQVDLSEVVESVLALTGHKLELNDILLARSLSNEPLKILGNRNQLQQCFLNLIFNAIEAMPKGGTLTVVSDRETATFASVKIGDSGSGISQQDMEHIFDPFFTTKEAGQGTGLGLSIVYGIVKDHGGSIKATSKGVGSSFKMLFPLVADPQQEADGCFRKSVF
ncbi:MAG: ATP-binding protein [Desulfobacterium sp.]|nr:ATP-binding protein [Desulfobacterium sp.]